MLVVSTTVGVLHGVHGHTTHLWGAWISSVTERKCRQQGVHICATERARQVPTGGDARGLADMRAIMQLECCCAPASCTLPHRDRLTDHS